MQKRKNLGKRMADYDSLIGVIILFNLYFPKSFDNRQKFCAGYTKERRRE
jgi:hypothetical protein